MRHQQVVKGKAKQANSPKGIPDEKRSQITSERFFLDISSVKTRSFGGSKFWLLLVDDATGFQFSYVLKKKSETAEKVIALMKHLKATVNDLSVVITLEKISNSKKRVKRKVWV